ncbi:MAG: ribokinase [Clostridia bacterium]|nr:ribokinase [Oscillospiraceae bacterium]MBP3294672.1 ribokinase [Clostridia bacterium]MBQ7312413.1 ribokinase [Clostridia bacterium]
MKNQRILVISSANIDFVQRMRRIPYAGETVVENDIGYSYVPGGKGANSAVTFARLGADCVFTCKLGRDSNAKRLTSIYRNEGIDIRYILEDPEVPTGLASILVEENGKNRIIVYPGANMTMTAADIEEPFTCYPEAVYMQLEIPDEAILEAARRAHEANIPVFIDAGPARIDFPLKELGRVEIFSPNESETRIFTGIAPTNDETCLRAAIRLSNLVDAKYIVIKLGERGAFIYDVGGKEYFVVPAEKVEAVDTTAAGDVFTAAMVYVYLQNGSIVSAVKYATCAAAISVTRAGASTSIPTRAEVIAYARKKKAEESGETVPENSAEEPASGDEEMNEI